MHELSIASQVLHTVLNECDQKGYSKVVTVALQIGALTDIVPSALTFGFDILKKDTLLHNTELTIEQVPVTGKCNCCNKQFKVKEFVFVCPYCQAVDITLEKGDELDIAYLEIDE